MILIVGAFVLLAVAIALAVWRTRDAAQVTRTGIAGRIPSGPWLLVLGALALVGLSINIALVPSDGGLILDVGNLPIASPEPEPTPAP